MEATEDPDGPRSGVRPLLLLATTLDYLIVRALDRGPLRLAELRRGTGLPAQTTLREHLSGLRALGIVARRPLQAMPHAVEHELTPAGRGLLRVAASLEAWLNHAPGGPLSLGTGAARGVVKAFAEGWGSAVLGTLARRPMSLTELDGVVPALSYPALERRLASMRIAGLIERAPARGAGTPYVVTDWARRGVVPLAAASHCEQVAMQPLAVPLTRVDVAAAFMLSVPLVGLPPEAAGRCHLTVEGDLANGRERSGVEVVVEGGRAVACASDRAAGVGEYAAGSPSTWFSAVRDARVELLDHAGGKLPAQLVRGLHEALLDPAAATAGDDQLAATSRAAASPTKGTSSS